MSRLRKKLERIVLSAVMGMLSFAGSNALASVVFVSGDVSGVWSADTVIVADSVHVPAGQTLTIMPGVEVYFTSYYKFEILNDAVLHAVGTESDSIKFLPLTQDNRSLGLDFISASSQSILEYCYISDALTSAVHCENSDITIRNCLFENNEAPSGSQGGGGIELLDNSNAIIEYNTIRNNTSAVNGGGIFCSASSPIIKGNMISGNLAGNNGNASGGGIGSYNGANPQIIGNWIINNNVNPVGGFSMSYGDGGGLVFDNSTSALLTGNIITGNRVNWTVHTRSNGGGIYLYHAYITISNNIIANNTAQLNNGGGINMYSSFPVLVNNTIAYNSTGESGGGIYSDFSSPEVINTIVYGNSDSAGMQIYSTDSNIMVSYSDVQGGYSGQGNIDVNPMFRDPFSGDYHLQDSLLCGDDYYSMCIDAGSPDYSDSLIDCSFAHGTNLSDIGAYGGGFHNTTGITDPFNDTPYRYDISQNYPNPFNAYTVISYSLKEPTNTRIDIFDELGRKVETLYDGFQDSGDHSVTWNASNVSSGTYFYKIQTDNFVESRKMLLLK